MSVYHILNTLGTKMHPYITFLCTKLQGNQIIRFHFMVTSIPSKTKRRKKTKKLSLFLKLHILEAPGAI